jgi:hypothetical protein
LTLRVGRRLERGLLDFEIGKAFGQLADHDTVRAFPKDYGDCRRGGRTAARHASRIRSRWLASNDHLDGIDGLDRHLSMNVPILV